MHFETNATTSRNITSSALQIARNVAVAFSVLVLPSADAGLIETSKEAAHNASSSAESPVGVTAAKTNLSVSLVSDYTRKLNNALADKHANPMNLSAVIDLADPCIGLREFTMAVINANARRNATATDAYKHGFFLNHEEDIAPLNGQADPLTCVLSGYKGDLIKTRTESQPDDNSEFLISHALASGNNNDNTMVANAPGRRTIVEGEYYIPGHASHAPKSSGEDQDQEKTKDELNDDESLDDNSSADVFGDATRLLMPVDSFDPVVASVVFLLLSGVAVAVNVIPRSFDPTPQL